METKEGVPKEEGHGAAMTIWDHLKELRKRLIVSMLSLIVCSVVAYIFYDNIVAVLTKPFENIQKTFSTTLVVTSVVEGFMIKFKVAFWAGLVFSFPVHIFNIVRFVFPGLKSMERRVVIWSLFSSFILIVLNAYFIYFYVVPYSVKFLVGSDFVPKGVGIMLHFGENIFYVFMFLLFSLIAFQFPVVLEILLVLKVVKRKTLWNWGRYIVVGIFILAAIVTPPDFVSQLSLALPMVALFYLTLLVAKIFKFGE